MQKIEKKNGNCRFVWRSFLRGCRQMVFPTFYLQILYRATPETLRWDVLYHRRINRMRFSEQQTGFRKKRKPVRRLSQKYGLLGVNISQSVAKDRLGPLPRDNTGPYHRQSGGCARVRCRGISREYRRYFCSFGKR